MTAWRRYLRFWGANVDADIDDELRLHLEMRAREYEAAGKAPDEAMRLARERFGNYGVVSAELKRHDESRAIEARRRDSVAAMLRDLRGAGRRLRHAPGFAATVVFILGLGIGMAAAMFSVLHITLLRPLPVQQADRIAVLWPYRVPGSELSPTIADVREFASRSRTTLATAGVSHWGVGENPFIDGDRTLRFQQALTTINFFDVLGARPALGRFFNTSDDVVGFDRAVVLSHRTWVSQFASDRSVVGKRLRDPYTNAAYTIVGVAPAGLDYPVGVDVWRVTTRADSTVRVFAIARLAPTISIDAARAEYFAIINRLEPAWKLTGASGEPLTTAIIGNIEPIVLALAGAAAVLLVIACVNIGNLFLVRVSSRDRELAVRRALGAGRVDLMQQLLAECVPLIAGGALLGGAAAEAFLHVLRRVAPAQIPRVDEIVLDPLSLVTAVVIVSAVTMLFGLAPALLDPNTDLGRTLRNDSRSGNDTIGRRRARDWLVGVQVALAVGILAGAGLLVRSVINLQQLDLGYQTEHLSIMSLAFDPRSFQPQDTSYAGGVENALLRDEEFERRIGAVPGVIAVTPILTNPFMGTGINVGLFRAEDQDDQQAASNPPTPWDLAGVEYFRTLGIRVLRGRAFTSTDRVGAMPVAIVSEGMARRLWPGQDPLGKRLRFQLSEAQSKDPSAPPFLDWRTVVGIVPDTHFRELKGASATMYVPWRQLPNTWGIFAVRSGGDPQAVATGIRSALAGMGHGYVMWRFEPFNEILDGPLATPRLTALLLGGFAVVALVLCAVGLYGVTSFSVRQQIREIGIRMALGATADRVRDGILRRALQVAGIGVGAGLMLALVGGRSLRTLLFEVQPADAATLVAICVLVGTVALLAAYLPARRATQVDPVEALRAQ